MKTKFLVKTTLYLTGIVFSLILAVYITGIYEQDSISILETAMAEQQGAQAGVKDNVPLGRKPVAIVDGQYPASYFPNTELLGPDEMRITALGTGMPNQTRAAVSISYLVELGNGDKFLFDMGMGSMANLFSLRPDFSKLDKVFASHLHIDHVGDFMGLHIGGWLSGRYAPIHIYGPTGSTPELGTKAFIDAMSKGYAWDLATRSGALPDLGAKIEVHEFDYKQQNKIVYQENGVTIRSWPAIHALDGSVSFSLEWNGLKYVFGGDTYPNKWYIEYAKNADVASHEAFLPPEGPGCVFWLGPGPGNMGLDENPHRTPSLWQGHVRSQTAPGCWLPLGAIP